MLDVAVGLVINEAKEVLITLRSASSLSCPSLWEFPGGKINAGELAHQAVIRELKEEVNLGCKHVEHWLTHESDGVRLHVFLVRHYLGKACCLESQQELRWVSLHALATHDFPPSNQAIINKMKTLDDFY